MRTEVFLAKHPVFTYEEFLAVLGDRGSSNKRTRDALLRHHLSNGRVQRVRRGVFVSGLDTSNPVSVDPYLLCTKLALDSVLAYHTALQFWGKTYSVFNEFNYLTRTATRQLVFQGQSFTGVPYPKPLVKKDQEFFGVQVADRLGLDVRVTSLERTLVDVMTRPELGGGWEEIWRSLEMVEYFDLDQIVEYALLLENATTVAKVGYLP